MPDYSIAVAAVPVGGRAVADISVYDAGVPVDVTSVTADWRDAAGTLVESLTRTSADVSGTDLYGNASTLIDIVGTGTYRATLVIDSSVHTPPSIGEIWTLTVTVVSTGGGGRFQVFSFTVLPTTLSITIGSQALATVAMRSAGIVKDVPFVANGVTARIPLGSGIVYGIVAAYKNGVAISSPTNYSWSLYKADITPVVATAAGDSFLFTIQTRSTDWVTDKVNMAVQEVVRALMTHYDTTADALLQSPSLIEVTKALAVSMLKMEIAEGSGSGAHFKSAEAMQKEARKAIIRIQRGEDGIYDTTGAEFARRSGSLVGGYQLENGPAHAKLQQREAWAEAGLYIQLVDQRRWPTWNPETL